MKKIYLLLTLILLIAMNGFSQTHEADKKKPFATVTQISGPSTPSSLIIQVNELTQYDEILTEMVIGEIYNRKQCKITCVMDDKDFEKNNSEIQSKAIKKSEVMEIINLLKN